MTLATNIQKSPSEQAFSPDQTVQVLALDGGGLRGLFAASVIQAIEDHIGHSISKHFDIITGTSTGGLIALALGLEKPGSDLVSFYKDYGPEIFPDKPLQRTRRWCMHWLFSKYSNKPLERTLKQLLSSANIPEPLLGDSQKRLIIPTFIAANSKPRLLKTPHDQRYRTDWKMPMWAVAMATSAAPTYLPSFKHCDVEYLDGGLWANNPSLIGVIEAKEMGAKIENIRVLNISTTSCFSDCLTYSPFPVLRQLRLSYGRLGKLPWASKILSVTMGANSFATTNMYLRQLLSAGNLAHIDQQLNAPDLQLDHIHYEQFISLGRDAGQQAIGSLANYFDHEAAPYEPNPIAIGKEND